MLGVHAGAAISLQHFRREHINAHAQHQVRRLEVKIVARALHAWPAALPKHGCQIGFIRPLVLAEAYVAVEAEQRAINPRIGIDVRRQFLEPFSHRHYKPLRWLHHEILVLFTMRFEPEFVIVLGEMDEEFHTFLWKSVERKLLAHKFLPWNSKRTCDFSDIPYYRQNY